MKFPNDIFLVAKRLRWILLCTFFSSLVSVSLLIFHFGNWKRIRWISWKFTYGALSPFIYVMKNFEIQWNFWRMSNFLFIVCRYSYIMHFLLHIFSFIFAFRRSEIKIHLYTSFILTCRDIVSKVRCVSFDINSAHNM